MHDQGLAGRLRISSEVALTLDAGGPVVALESTLISHGLPYPDNLAVARASEAAVRRAGAVPATVAIRDGWLLIGLGDDELEALARAPAGTVSKASRATLALALARGGWAATTVSTTLIGAVASGIRVFATGGIGGVHRGAFGGSGAGLAVPPSLDVSADLDELARSPVVVVCAGPKSILDVPATLEYLETRGVPVVAIGQPELPGFFTRSAGIAAPASVPDVAAAAELAAVHLGLGLGGLLACVAVPSDAALPDDAARAAVLTAHDDAARAGIRGPALTPWLLARIAEISGGASIRANRALIVNDAAVAGQLAVDLSGRLAAQDRRPRQPA